MAIHTLAHKPSAEASPTRAPAKTTVSPNDPPQHSWLDAGEEDEMMAVEEEDEEHELIPVTIEL
jgi:hypothetical protein